MGNARIVINGTPLTEAQAITVLLALDAFRDRQQEEGLGDDERGQALSSAYAARADEVIGLIHNEPKNSAQHERSRESEIQELIEKVHAWFGQPENTYEGIFHLMFEAGNVEQEFAELTVAEARKRGNEAEIDLAERLAALTVAERDRIYNAW